LIHSFKIQQLNIYESYFKGKVNLGNKEFTINVQTERRGKVLKLPIPLQTKKDRYLVRLTGPGNTFIEDLLRFMGDSEWVELDSDEITFYIADHQDQLDTLEIIDE
jgi:hypothetical protein